LAPPSLAWSSSDPAVAERDQVLSRKVELLQRLARRHAGEQDLQILRQIRECLFIRRGGALLRKCVLRGVLCLRHARKDQKSYEEVSTHMRSLIISNIQFTSNSVYARSQLSSDRPWSARSIMR